MDRFGARTITSYRASAGRAERYDALYKDYRRLFASDAVREAMHDPNRIAAGAGATPLSARD